MKATMISKPTPISKSRIASNPRMISKSIGILGFLIVSLGSCTKVLPLSAFEGSGPEMRPETFFAGTTNSSGILEDSSGAPTSRFRVAGSGQTLPDGSFRLTQSITFDRHAPETRTWVMRRLDAHRYAATLTDASGTVEGEAYGDMLHIRYPMKTPFGGQMEQWLYLQPDGRTVMNEATIRLFSVVVAHLSERITHEGP